MTLPGIGRAVIDAVAVKVSRIVWPHRGRHVSGGKDDTKIIAVNVFIAVEVTGIKIICQHPQHSSSSQLLAFLQLSGHKKHLLALLRRNDIFEIYVLERHYEIGYSVSTLVANREFRRIGRHCLIKPKRRYHNGVGIQTIGQLNNNREIRSSLPKCHNIRLKYNPCRHGTLR